MLNNLWQRFQFFYVQDNLQKRRKHLHWCGERNEFYWFKNMRIFVIKLHITLFYCREKNHELLYRLFYIYGQNTFKEMKRCHTSKLVTIIFCRVNIFWNDWSMKVFRSQGPWSLSKDQICSITRWEDYLQLQFFTENLGKDRQKTKHNSPSGFKISSI